MTRLALFVAATVVTDCSKSGNSHRTGTLTGYEIGNQEDFGAPG